MTWLLIIGGLVVVGLGLAVAKLVLDDVAENHDGPGAAPYDTNDSGWWPDADEPIDLEITPLGELAMDVYALDEKNETWGPA